MMITLVRALRFSAASDYEGDILQYGAMISVDGGNLYQELFALGTINLVVVIFNFAVSVPQ